MKIAGWVVGGALFFVVVMIGSAVAGVATSPVAAAGFDTGFGAASTPASGAAFSAQTAASPVGAPPASAALTAYEQTESDLESHYTGIANSLIADGVPARLIHLPSTEPAGYINGDLVPGPLYAAETQTPTTSYETGPTPAGIAYYGQSGSNSAPTKTVVDTSSLQASLNVTNLSSLYLDTDDPDQWGVQLNAVATNVSLEGSDGTGTEGYAFWAQNVIGYQGFNHTLQFDENTWNFSSTAESFPTNWTALTGTPTVVANDTNDTLYSGEVYIGESHFFYAPMPFNLTLYLNLSLVNSQICSPWSSLASTATCSNPSAAIADYTGDQTLYYNYSLSFPSSNTLVAPGTHYTGNFDWLTFHTAKGVEDHGANTRSAGFEASGSANDAIGLSDDYELDFGIGAYDGANQNVFDASGTASLSYVSDCGSSRPADCTIPASPTYKSVPAALNFGSETGETATGIDVNFESGTDVATFSAGPLNVHPLWGYTQTGVSAGQTAVTNNLQVSGSPLSLSAEPYIFVFLEDTSITSPAASYAWAPDVPVWYLMPGTYNYEAMLADYTEQTGSITVGTSPTTLTATLPYATSNGVYTPLWAVTPTGSVANAELAGISTSGAGTISSQYLLFHNNDTASSAALNSVFDSHNDYDFPTFAGVLLWNTTAYVEDKGQIEFYSSSSTYGYLQQQFYETQHVTIANTHDILGWAEMTSLFESTAAQNTIPQGNVMIWNSTDDLVLNNTFEAEKAHSSSFVALDDLLLYGGGSECSVPYDVAPAPPVNDPCGGTSGPAPAGSQNVVFGNEFCDTACTTSPSSPGTYAGIAEAENGDLIYNNNFLVDNPAPLLPWNLATEEGPYSYVNTWNVSEQAAGNVAETVNGFALSGNVLNTGSSHTYALQGGNHWWNYGGPSGSKCASPYTAVPGCLNSYANATYGNQVDYTDGAATIFPPPYVSNYEDGLQGVGDGSPIGGFDTSFTEAGLPSGVQWFVNVTLPGQSSPYSLTNTTSGSSGVTVALYLADGSYAFTVATSNAKYAPSYTPTVTVRGVAQTVAISFSLVTYAVTFTESGLPSETSWTVTLASSPSSSTSSSIVFSEPNGSYAYAVTPIAGYSVSPVAGSVTVDGGAVTVDVTFTLETYTVAFNESGLANGTPWTVALDDVPASSTSAAISFAEPNGSYTYAVTPIAGYTVSPSSGSVTVAGADVTVNVTFSLVTYSVEFEESGLPTATLWNVSFSYDAQEESTNVATISFQAPNGSFAYSVGAVPGYTATPNSGTVDVNGESQTVDIAFTPVTYSATFTETGLPANTSWSVSFGGVNMSSTNDSIAFTVPNGTYAYAVGAVAGYTVNPVSGSATVAGADLAIGVVYSPYDYTVTFNESGLPVGTNWSVALDGNGAGSVTSSIVFVVPNGSYSFAVGTVAGYAASPNAGMVSVDGAATVTNITFAPVVQPTYAVDFSESGLPSGTSWSVTANGSTESSTGPTIEFSEMNGTYAYSIGAVAGYTANVTSGMVTVNGASAQVSIGFAPVAVPTYLIAFALPSGGNPAGIAWSVTLNGTTESSMSIGPIEFDATNGSYPYTVTTVAGYTVTPSSGTVEVDGAGATVSVTLAQTHYSLEFVESGLPAGKSWNISLDGRWATIPGTSATYSAGADTSYSYLITGPSGERVSGIAPAGAVAVGTAPVVVSFEFVRGATYAFSFTESGLPHGQSWCVDIAQTAMCGSTSAQHLKDLSPGTYSYALVSPLTGQTVTAKSGGVPVATHGNVTLTTKGTTIALKFVYDYPVTFTESGLPAGTSWSVKLGGVTETSTTATIVFEEKNGSYGYSIGAETGYKATGSPTRAHVVGGPVAISVTFTPKVTHGGAPAAAPAAGRPNASVGPIVNSAVRTVEGALRSL